MSISRPGQVPLHPQERLKSTALGSGRVSLIRQEQQVVYYSLKGSLPEGDRFALNIPFGILTYLTLENGLACQVAQQQFTPNEMSILCPLLDNHPYYCPYEELYASFYLGSAEKEQQARQQLEEAKESGIWDEQMRPIRNVLSRVRLKMRMMYVDIKAVLETGYMLQFMGR